MKKTLFPLVLLSAAALAAENITGAFGLELGAVQDTSNLESTYAVKGKDSSCYKEYYIKPPSPNEIFTDYTVTLTPVLNKIMEIQGFNTLKGNCIVISSKNMTAKYRHSCESGNPDSLYKSICSCSIYLNFLPTAEMMILYYFQLDPL